MQLFFFSGLCVGLQGCKAAERRRIRGWREQGKSAEKIRKRHKDGQRVGGRSGLTTDQRRKPR